MHHGCISSEPELCNYTKILTLCKTGNNSSLSKLPFVNNRTSKLVLHCGNFESGLAEEKISCIEAVLHIVGITRIGLVLHSLLVNSLYKTNVK